MIKLHYQFRTKSLHITMSKYGYLDFQGRGQVSRLLLAYTKTPHEQITYTQKTVPQWITQDKVSLGLDFPSLPYWIEGDFKLTESQAIQRYVCLRSDKKAQLLGSNSKQSALIDNISSLLKDIFNELIKLFLSPNFGDDRKPTYDKLKPKFQHIQKYLGQRPFFLDRVSYPDFTLTVIVDYLKFFFPHEIGSWSKMLRVAESVKQLLEIKQYYARADSVQQLMFPSRSSKEDYHNLKPLSEQAKVQAQKQQVILEQKSAKQNMPQQTVKELSVVTTDAKPQQAQQEQPVNNQQKPTDQPQKSHNQVTEPAMDKKTSNSGNKSISSRLQDYMKATEASNTKGTEPSKVQRVSSHLTKNSSQNWLNKGNNQGDQDKHAASKVVLGYWGIRGLGQIQRHLLAFCRVDFIQKTYTTQQEWFTKDKPTIGLPFPNLPYLFDGDLKLTESISIERYIINQYGNKQLLGQSLRDSTYIESIVRVLVDMFKQLRVICFADDPEGQQRKQLFSKIEPQIKSLNQFISQESKHTMGYLSWADFHIAEVSHYIQKLYPEEYAKYNFWQRIRSAVEELEQVKTYYQRDGAVKGPFIPPIAKISF